ncbi:MAG TPA: HAMP domain-containing sensor histidine kinase, partial [Labilithrix sp.]|nr:HAMP domain-containing sensor histidine kinase [Labilithrix sp.]
ATPPEGVEADVGDVLRDVLEELRPSAEATSTSLQLEPPTPSMRVACSPGVLISIVSNLVGNAIKHMDAAAIRRITVRTSDQRSAVRIEVCDTGPGVPPSERERIFDPYARAASAGVPGLGLGLATVRRLAEAHGGRVGVSPNEPTGSIFWFELPKSATPERQSLLRLARAWLPRMG